MAYGEGKPELYDGFTRIASEILDAISRTSLADYESRCVHYLWRKTYGWQNGHGESKKSDAISYSQWEAGTAIDRRNVWHVLQGLVDRHIFIKQEFKLPGKNVALVWSFQKYYKKWVGYVPPEVSSKNTTLQPQPSSKQTMLPLQPSCESTTDSLKVSFGSPQGIVSTNEGSIVSTNEDNKYIIDNITIDKGDSYGVLVKNTSKVTIKIEKETWGSFLEMRKKVKAPLTKKAEGLLFKKLARLQFAGDDANKVLEQSIMNAWKGVFHLDKGGKHGTSSHQGYSTQFSTNYKSPEEVFGKGYYKAHGLGGDDEPGDQPSSATDSGGATG
jgi:phage replication O-like protein O